MPTSTYLLPSSTSYTCLDRFSLHPDPNISEDENGHVPFWPILESLLTKQITSAAALIDTLETISVTLTGTTAPATDYHLLCDAISEYPDFFSRIWEKIVLIALLLPAWFPQDSLPVLGRGEKKLVLTRRQTACLVVHQFLRTLKPPDWKSDGTHDFGIWYSRERQKQESTARAYLKALMVYFDEVVSRTDGMELENWDVVYALHEKHRHPLLDEKGVTLSKVDVVMVDEYDTLPASLGLSGGAAVISANRYIGFGQSATQEEIHVGISPEACPAVLVTPPLKDSQILVVEGAQAMVNLVGQRREIRVGQMGVPEGGIQSWQERRMLFMDALELDLVDEGAQSQGRILPDLLEGNVQREIDKAYMAFSSGGFTLVRTGLWGCGAFCGDPAVKFLIMWYAASIAGVHLVVVCDEQSHTVAGELKELISVIKNPELASHWWARNLDILLRLAPATLVRNETSSWFKSAIPGIFRR